MSFWQKIQHGVTQAASQAAAEASKQTAVARKNLELNSVRGDIRRKTNELGDEALVLFRQGAIAHDGLAVIVKEIEVLELREAELKREIADVKDDSSTEAADVVSPAADSTATPATPATATGTYAAASTVPTAPAAPPTPAAAATETTPAADATSTATAGMPGPAGTAAASADKTTPVA
jgi:pilus assembly protein FimV